MHLTALAARRDYLARKVADPDLAGRQVYLKHEIAALEFVLAVPTPIVQSVRADDPAVDRQARRRHFVASGAPRRERLSIDTVGEPGAAR